MAGAQIFSHAGLSENDFTPGTIRTEMSDTLFAALYLRPNLISAIPIGMYGGGGTGVGAAAMQLLHYWAEDRLNSRTVTDTTGGINAAVTQMTISAADANNLNPMDVIRDQSQAFNASEYIQVQGISIAGATATLTIARAFNNSTATTHASGAVFEVVMTPNIQGSDFGRDQSRVPGLKNNLIYTIRKDVQITGSLLALSKHGLVVGMPNVMATQLHNRFLEAMIDLERTLIGGLGTPAATQTETPTPWGLMAALGFNNPAFNSTSVTFNANNAFLSELLLNSLFINILLQGAEIPDCIVAHPTVMDRIGRIYRDQFRLNQNEDVRGFLVRAVQPSVGEQLVRLVMSGYMPGPAPGATTPAPVLFALDLDRIATVPFLDQFCYLLAAGTLKDADLVSLVMKLTWDIRNTGTDFGYSHQAMFGFTV
jgi:hypothetical protein